MLHYTSLFLQLQGLLPRQVFDEAVSDCGGDAKVQRVSCWSHFCCLLLALLSHRASLRSIEDSFENDAGVLRTLGIGSVDRSTVSYANRHRPAAVVAALFPALVQRCNGVLFHVPRRFRQKLYLLDATVIGLCETLFPWARWARGRSGVKLHLMYDADGGCPVDVQFTTSLVYEIGPARERPYAAGTILCFDRAYFDTAWLHKLTQDGVTFVTRMPPRPRYEVVRERRPVPAKGVIRDRLIRFTGERTSRNYPGLMRCIHYVDAATGRDFLFVTNRLHGCARMICDIHRARWQIEAFFKWFKNQLRVKTFYGRSPNAVQWQLWTALCLYLLMAWLRLQSRTGWSLITLQRKLERYLLDKINLSDLLKASVTLQT
jgi:hypothetical protein